MIFRRMINPVDLNRLRKIGRDVEHLMGAPDCGKEVIAAADEIQKLRLECKRLLARGDKAELELKSLKNYYARRFADELSTAAGGDPSKAVSKG